MKRTLLIVIYQSILRKLHLTFPTRLLRLVVVRFILCVHTRDTYLHICSRTRNHICMSCGRSHRSFEPSICIVRIALRLHFWPILQVGGLPQVLCCWSLPLLRGLSIQRRFSPHDIAHCTWSTMKGHRRGNRAFWPLWHFLVKRSNRKWRVGTLGSQQGCYPWSFSTQIFAVLSFRTQAEAFWGRPPLREASYK